MRKFADCECTAEAEDWEKVGHEDDGGEDVYVMIECQTCGEQHLNVYKRITADEGDDDQ